MKTEPIQDFILMNQRNLGVAAAISLAWAEAREKLVDGFLDRLELRMKKKLKGWESERSGEYFTKPYPNFSFSKPAWSQEYYVYLQFEQGGQKMTFGLLRNFELKHIRKRPRCAELLTVIGKAYPSAIAGKWWEAKVTMRSPAADWQQPDVLWRMHKDRSFLNNVAEQLLEVARISEPVVDRLVRKKSKRR